MDAVNDLPVIFVHPFRGGSSIDPRSGLPNTERDGTACWGTEAFIAPTGGHGAVDSVRNISFNGSRHIVALFEEAALQMGDATEHLAFWAIGIGIRVLVNQRDPIAGPLAKWLTLMQINPAGVRGHLLAHAGVGGALRPRQIDPFHAADRGDELWK